MSRRASMGRLAVALATVAVAFAACGGDVVVDRAAAPVDAVDAGGAVDAAALVDASIDASPEPPVDASVDGRAPDAAPDAGSTDCEDPSVCSRVQTRDGCYRRTRVGDFCDFFATPCAQAPLDCAKLDGLFGMKATGGDCGGGTSTCHVDWVGTVDDAMLTTLCAARDAVGAPVDCMMD